MQRFELSDGSSNKFWQIAREGETLRITFGKVGSKGQTQLKTLGSEAGAIVEIETLIREKTRKGYVAVGAETTATPKVATPAPEYVLEERFIRRERCDGSFEGLLADWASSEHARGPKETIAGLEKATQKASAELEPHVKQLVMPGRGRQA